MTFFFFPLLTGAFAERTDPVKGACLLRGGADPLLGLGALPYWKGKGKNVPAVALTHARRPFALYEGRKAPGAR